MILTVDAIDELKARAPTTASRITIEWMSASSHEEKFKLLRTALDHCYGELVNNKHLNREGKVSEDQLSVQICQMLGCMGIVASHDTQVGGHVDILVRDRDGFLWIGEAKIDHGPSYVAGGFDQLSTRYGTSGEGRNQGEMIVYSWKRNIAKRLKDWLEHLEGLEGVQGLEVEVAIEDPKWHFTTKHTCPASGHLFHVRHVFVPLYFAPKK